MQDVFALGRVPYVQAEPLRKNTWPEHFMFWINLFCDIIKVLILSIPNWFLSMYHLIFYPTKKCVRGQTVLITGGGNGIGKALAFKFAQYGCNIAVADIDGDAAKATAHELIAMNVIAHAYKVDVADVDQVQKLKYEIERDIAPVDILINNAGILPLLSLREGTEIEIERIVKVNITSQFFVTRTFLPGMITRKRGHIVGMSSLSALHPHPNAVIYTATKFAVQGFIRALSEELRQEGSDFIKLTAVHPYFTSTRKDLMDGVNLRFPVITTDEAATATVNAILRNEHLITIPKFNLWLCIILNLLSYSNQSLIRDYVLKERETRKLYYEEKKMLRNG